MTNFLQRVFLTTVLMTTVLLTTVFTLGEVFAVQPFVNPSERLDYFVFLVTGKSAEGTAKAEMEQMQKAHVGNFGRLAGLGELSAAGPCSDPEKRVRGIVVVHATSLVEAEAKFGADPYVTQGFMKTEIHPYKALTGKFVIPTDTTKLDQYTLAIVSQAGNWPADVEQTKAVQDAFQSFAKEHSAAGKLGFAAMFSGRSNNQTARVAVMVFHGNEQANVERLFSEWKLVQDNVIKVQVFPQYLVKDAMRSE